MAAIDKTYIYDWETFKEIRDWAKNKSFVLKNGEKINLIDYFYYPNLTEKEFNEYKTEYEKEYSGCIFEIVLWNTPIYVDIWLIRNCPFEFIQDRLKEQYGGGWSKTAFTDHNDEDMYTQIKEHRSIYDTYQRNGLGKKAKIKFYNLFGSFIRDKKCFWSIEVNPPWLKGKPINFNSSSWYNETDDMWYWNEEAMPWTCSCCHKKGTMTKKNIVNLIKKWNLPKGTIVQFSVQIGRYLYHEFYCTVN